MIEIIEKAVSKVALEWAEKKFNALSKKPEYDYKYSNKAMLDVVFEEAINEEIKKYTKEQLEKHQDEIKEAVIKSIGQLNSIGLSLTIR